MTSIDAVVLQESWQLVLAFFKGDEARALFWFCFPNSSFGGISPAEMIVRGREEKVLQLIRSQRDEFSVKPEAP